MSPSDMLIAAKELIIDKKNWTPRAYARDSLNRIVPTTSPEACKFCAIGAVLRVAGEGYITDLPVEGHIALECLEKSGTYGTTHTNDSRGHEAVLELYDKAILLAQKYEQPHENVSPL